MAMKLVCACLCWLAIALSQAGLLTAQAAETQGGGFECVVLLDAAAGKPLLREGECDRPVSPASTFKVPLALIGYDAGILIGETAPAWKYRAEFDAPERDHKTVDPTIWERDSVLWYSREITRRLGAERFAGYVSKFGYGNADVSGDPGKDNGLTKSWVNSSLLISADQQADFVNRLLADKLPVSAQASAMTRTILPRFNAGDGWTLHGKTGAARIGHSEPKPGQPRLLAWFVGWAEKGDRRIPFARLLVTTKKAEGRPGPMLRDRFLKEFPDLLRRIE